MDTQNLAITWAVANTQSVFALFFTNNTNFNFQTSLAQMMAPFWYVISSDPNVELVYGKCLSVYQTFHCFSEVRHGWCSRQSNDQNKGDRGDLFTCDVTKVATTWSHPCIEHTQLGKLTAREVPFTLTFNRLTIPLCTSNITHKQKYLHGEPIILESATRNNLAVYTAINIILIYFSWGTVRNKLQQHQKGIWKLVTPIWWWVRFSGTHTACTYLSIHLQLPYIQTKKMDMEKIHKIFPSNKCVHICACARTHTHTHTPYTQLKW